MSTATIIVLVVVAVLGHAMALFWYLAVTRGWAISRRVIYDLPISNLWGVLTTVPRRLSAALRFV